MLISSQKGVHFLRGSPYVTRRPVQETHAAESRIRISAREEIDDALRPVLHDRRWHLVAATMPSVYRLNSRFIAVTRTVKRLPAYSRSVKLCIICPLVPEGREMVASCGYAGRFRRSPPRTPWSLCHGV